MDYILPLAGDEKVPGSLPFMLANPATEQEAMRVIPAVVSSTYLGTARQGCLYEEVDQCGLATRSR
jgi:hypothetical protein